MSGGKILRHAAKDLYEDGYMIGKHLCRMKMIDKMHEKGLSDSQIAEILGISAEDVHEADIWVSRLRQRGLSDPTIAEILEISIEKVRSCDDMSGDIL